MLTRGDINRQVSDQLKPGNILYLYCDFTNPPKWKYLVLVGLFGKAHFFIINSYLSNFIQQRDELLKCQVCLYNADYNFLTRNSYIDCTKVKKIDIHDISEQIACHNKAGFIAKLLPEDVKKVMGAIDNAVTLTTEEKKKFKVFIERSIQ